MNLHMIYQSNVFETFIDPCLHLLLEIILESLLGDVPNQSLEHKLYFFIDQSEKKYYSS